MSLVEPGHMDFGNLRRETFGLLADPFVLLNLRKAVM